MQYFGIIPLFMAVASANAQNIQYGRKAIAADSVPGSIATAEAEGARYPRLAPGDTATNPLFLSAEGKLTVARRCVEASGESNNVRTGDFMFGPLAKYSSVWNSGYGKMYFVPFHGTVATAEKLTVRAARLDGKADAIVLEIPLIGHAVGALTHLGYPSGLRLPTAGKWMIVANAGNNWGCLIYNLK